MKRKNFGRECKLVICINYSSALICEEREIREPLSQYLEYLKHQRL